MKVYSPILNINNALLDGLSADGIQGYQGYQGQGQDNLIFTDKTPKMIYSYVKSIDGGGSTLKYLSGITGHNDFEYQPGNGLYLFNANFEIYKYPEYAGIQTKFFEINRDDRTMSFEGFMNLRGYSPAECGDLSYNICDLPVISQTSLGRFVENSSLRYTTQNIFIVDQETNPKGVLTTNNLDNPITVLFGNYQVGAIDGYYIDATVIFEKAFTDIPNVVATIKDKTILNPASVKSLVITEIIETEFSFHLSSSIENDFSNDCYISYSASGILS